MVEDETRRYKPTKNYLETLISLPPLDLTKFEVSIYNNLRFWFSSNDFLFVDRNNATRVRAHKERPTDGDAVYEEI